MIHFVLPRSMDFTIRNYLENEGRDLVGRTTLLYFEDLMAQTELPAGAYVLTALDQLYPAGRQQLAELCDQLQQAGPAVRVLNSPRATLRRFELLDELHRRGWNRHRAVRATGDLRDLRFPVFLHDEHRHEGALSSLLQTPAEVKAALARILVRGHRLKDLLVIEFCDTSDPEGLFRKYSAFVVGSRIVARSLECGRRWMLKDSVAEFTESTVREEQAYVFENPHERELRRIFEIARVEYGRIDYALKDGVIQTWEINLHPTIGRGPGLWKSTVPQSLQPFRAETRRHFYRLFQAAFETIDVAGQTPPGIAIRTAPTAHRLKTIPEHDRWGAIRRPLRPFRGLIDRIVGAVSPILIKLARRVG